MFPEMRDVLLYGLGFLVVVVVILVILILRKRIPLGSIFPWGKKEPVEAPKKGDLVPGSPEPGADLADMKSIKERLEGDLPVPGGGKEGEGPVEKGDAQPEVGTAGSVGVPPVKKDISQDGVVEGGVELGNEGEVPEEKEPDDSVDFIDIDEEEEDKKPEPEPVKEKELVARGVEKAKVPAKPAPGKINALEPKGVKTAEPSKSVLDTATIIESEDITKEIDTFLGQAVAVEGDLQLSSKGTDDVWYILFDKSGSSIVRSKEEIKPKHCKLLAKVEKTKLGQVYLDVTRYEKS
jgi:hypothetical protein